MFIMPTVCSEKCLYIVYWIVYTEGYFSKKYQMEGVHILQAPVNNLKIII